MFPKKGLSRQLNIEAEGRNGPEGRFVFGGRFYLSPRICFQGHPKLPARFRRGHSYSRGFELFAVVNGQREVVKAVARYYMFLSCSKIATASFACHIPCVKSLFSYTLS